MFSFGIAKGPKGARGIIWIMRLAPWMVHTRGASMWYGHLLVEKKILTERQKEYNDVHGLCRAHIEHLFARMCHWVIERNAAIFDSKASMVPTIWSVGTRTCTCMDRTYTRGP